jgi:hypothetical protein
LLCQLRGNANILKIGGFAAGPLKAIAERKNKKLKKFKRKEK